MSTTKTLQERLRAQYDEWAFPTDAQAPWMEPMMELATEAADALDAKNALLREAREVLRPFCERPDDWTVDQVNHARALLLKLNEATK